MAQIWRSLARCASCRVTAERIPCGDGNIPRCIEQNVDWASELIGYAQDRGVTRFEATQAAEADWSRHIEELAEGLLYTLVDSWMTGVNTNFEGRNVRRVLQYQGGAPQYREHCDAVAAAGYRGMVLA